MPSTGKQRAGVEARLAALQPEMAPFDAQLRSELKRNGETCPQADKQSDFQDVMRKFIEMSPEDFTASMEQRPAAEKGPAAPSDPKL